MEPEKQYSTSKINNIKSIIHQKFANSFTLIILFVAFIAISGLSFFLYPKIKSLKFKSKISKESIQNLPAPSKDILFLTSPVYQIQVKVESVSQNKIIASNEFLYNTSLNPEIAMILNTPPQQPIEASQTPIPTPITKKISFEIEINQNTIIERQNYYIPLLFPPENYNPNRLNYTEIKNGDLITITAKEDIRTIKGNKIEAIRVSLPPIQNTAEGKIVKIENNKIDIDPQGMMFMTPETTQQEGKASILSFLVDGSTEISYMPPVEQPTNIQDQMPEPPKPVKLDLNSLKESERVRIYTKGDILKSNSMLKAERIEPLERK